MSKSTTLAALVATALIGSLPQTAWSEDPTSSEPVAPAEQTPAPDSGVAPGPSPYTTPGGYAQGWQQPPHWRAPQQPYGRFPPHYPQAGQYPAYPAAPATTRESPLKAELKQAQEELSAKSSELDEARGLLDQLRGELQDSQSVEARLTNDLEYSNREQHALRVRVTELLSTLNSARTTLEQQHQLINDHQVHHRELSAENEQLHSELASQDEQLAALESELQAATQALAEARAMASTASEALSAARLQAEAHRDALAELEAELQRQASRLNKGK